MSDVTIFEAGSQNNTQTVQAMNATDSQDNTRPTRRFEERQYDTGQRRW